MNLSHLLNVDFYVLLEVVAVQVEHKVVDEVKSVTDNDQGQLVSQLGFLQRSEQRHCQQGRNHNISFLTLHLEVNFSDKL